MEPMTARSRLPLYEEILLLALEDEKGTAVTGLYRNAMAGAMLAELVMQGAVNLGDDKQRTVRVRPAARMDDPLLDEALQLIAAAKKPKPARHWVMKLAGIKDLHHRAARQLVQKGILREETGTVLRIFKRTVYPEADSGPERELIGRLEKAIFTGTPRVDERTLVIIALANATHGLGKVFDKKRLKARKDRIEKLVSGQLVGRATEEAVAAIQAAIMVTTIMPAVTAAR
jgi:hypothetical protein